MPPVQFAPRKRRSPISESIVERAIGSECLETVLANSVGLKTPIPIMGAGRAAAYDGCVIPHHLYGGGFSSIDDMVNKMTVLGGRQDLPMGKVGTATLTATAFSLWTSAGYPGAGSAPAAIAAGAVPTNATAGALDQSDAPSGTLHLYAVTLVPSTAPNVLLMYDRIWHGSGIAHSTTGNQTITGVPTRYSTTGSCPGNFITLEITNTLGVTAHNCSFNYTSDSNAAQTGATAVAVTVSSTATRLPWNTAPNWFWPLNVGDKGATAITRVTMSAVSSGTSNAVLGHPLAFIPQPVANTAVVLEGVGSALGLLQILNGACIAYHELKGVGSATTYSGLVTFGSG